MLKNILEVFKLGKIVTNPKAWKQGQITVGILVSLFSSLLYFGQTFGLDFYVPQDVLNSLATLIIFIFGLFINPALTIATTEKLGVPSGTSSTGESKSATDQARDFLTK